MSQSLLTEREGQIAALASKGATNAEIAAAIGVAERTVEWNLTRIYRKLGVRSKTELAARVAEIPWVRQERK